MYQHDQTNPDKSPNTNTNTNTNTKPKGKLNTLLKYLGLLFWVFLITFSLCFITSGAGLPLFGLLLKLTRIALALTIATITTGIIMISTIVNAILGSNVYSTLKTAAWVLLIAVLLTLLSGGAGLPLTAALAALPAFELAFIIGIICSCLTLLIPIIAIASKNLYEWIMLGLFKKFPILKTSFTLFLLISTIAAASYDVVAIAPTLFPSLGPIAFSFAIGGILVGAYMCIAAIFKFSSWMAEEPEPGPFDKAVSAQTSPHMPLVQPSTHIKYQQKTSDTPADQPSSDISFPCWPL